MKIGGPAQRRENPAELRRQETDFDVAELLERVPFDRKVKRGPARPRVARPVDLYAAFGRLVIGLPVKDKRLIRVDEVSGGFEVPSEVIVNQLRRRYVFPGLPAVDGPDN